MSIFVLIMMLGATPDGTWELSLEPHTLGDAPLLEEGLINSFSGMRLADGPPPGVTPLPEWEHVQHGQLVFWFAKELGPLIVVVSKNEERYQGWIKHASHDQWYRFTMVEEELGYVTLPSPKDKKAMSLRFAMKSRLKGRLLYSMVDYMSGTWTRGGTDYTVALSRTFNLGFPLDGTSLFIDRNLDGKCQNSGELVAGQWLEREVFNMQNAIILGDEAFKVSKLSEDGSSLVLSKVPRTAGWAEGQYLVDLDPAVNMKGEKIALESYKGKWLVVNIWSTSCGPCITEIPSLNDLKKSQGDRVAFLALTNDSHETLAAFFKKQSFDYDQGIMDLGREPPFNQGYPHHLLIDPKGNIVYETFGGSQGVGKKLGEILEHFLTKGI